MKVAIVGSRDIVVRNLGEYIPKETTEIISGGAKGVDTSAKRFAQEQGIKYTEFLPQYEKYGKAAPLKRNDLIIEYSDMVIVFGDGNSKGTKYVIDKCKKQNKTAVIHLRCEK